MKNKIIQTILFLSTLVLSYSTIIGQAMGYEVRRTNSKFIQQEKLTDVNKLSHLYRGFPASWIQTSDYISTELIVTSNGTEYKANGLNDILNNSQIRLIEKATIGNDITVSVKYNRISPLKNEKEVKTLNFALDVVPSVQAEYVDGYDNLKEYFKRNTVDQFPDLVEGQIEMATIKFTINESGKALMPTIIESSNKCEIDILLLKAMRNMPNWKPAEDALGNKIKQDIELIVGSALGC